MRERWQWISNESITEKRWYDMGEDNVLTKVKRWYFYWKKSFNFTISFRWTFTHTLFTHIFWIALSSGRWICCVHQTVKLYSISHRIFSRNFYICCLRTKCHHWKIIDIHLHPAHFGSLSFTVLTVSTQN